MARRKIKSRKRGRAVPVPFFKTSVAVRLKEPIRPWQLQKMLWLVDERVPIGELKDWTEEMRAIAEDWACRVHLRASDNVTVRVPQRPKFIPERVPLIPKGTPTGTLYDLIR